MYKGKSFKLLCKKHGLEFDYPSDWPDLHLPPPECSVCAIEKRETIEGRLAETESKLDTVLSALDIKMNHECKAP